MAKGKGSKRGGSRKSRAEDSTGAKENATEMRTGELGLGEPIVIDSDTFAMHLKSIKGATEKKDTAVSLLRGCMNAAKKVNEHLPEAIKLAIQEERSNDPSKLKKRLEVLGIALRETGSPVQLTVHDTLLGDVKQVAYDRGFKAGEGGQTLANPYPAGSDLSENYATGWRNGQAKLLGVNVDGEGDAAAGVVANGAGEGAHAQA